MIRLLPSPSAEESAFLTKTIAANQRWILPTVVEDDLNEVFRRSTFDSLKAAGLTSLLIPKAWGGQEASQGAYYRVLIELAKASASYSITVGVHQMIQAAVLGFGTAEQQKQFLPALVSGNYLGAFSLSEAGSGSDASALRTTAKQVTGGYEITGTKMWCSNGSDADLFLVMARTGEVGSKGISAFLVHKATKGFRVGKKEKKLGLKASSLTELIFENCFIPSGNRLGAEGEGFKIALSQLDAGRIGIAATALGLAQQTLESLWENEIDLTQKKWGDGTRGLWATYFARLQSVFSLLILATQEREKGNSITALASQCKLLASDLAMEMTSLAAESLGMRGILSGSNFERMMRDAKALQIVEGTNQIQKLVLSREMDKMVQK